VKEYLDKIAKSAASIRESPLRIAALIVLAIIIFSVLAALLVILTPKGTFEVECIQCGGRDGNLFIANGTSATFDVVVEVNDKDGNAVENATVKIYGGSEKAYAKTNADGTAVVNVDVTLNQGEQSAFLKVVVEKSGFKKYVESDFVVVTRG